jgi:uncharacterized protein (DUF427 family)
VPDLFDEPLEDRVIRRDPSVQPTAYTLRLEPTARRVRAVLGGVAVADSKRVKLLLESKHMPVYYFPADDVRMDLLELTERRRPDEHKGPARFFTLRSGDQEIPNAAWAHEDVPEGGPALAGHVAFYWNRMDAWYEEDDQVYAHPRDPYHRVDVLHSSRHVAVTMLGEVVAETRRPRLLFETNLPTRFYIPKSDVRMDLLRPSDTTSRCPYKGLASYWSLQVGDRLAHDIAWTYAAPVPECPKIEELICFFDERVESVVVDGEQQPKLETAWSKPAKITRV